MTTTDSEAVGLLIKVAKAWLTCNPWRAGELDSKTVSEAIAHLESGPKRRREALALKFIKDIDPLLKAIGKVVHEH